MQKKDIARICPVDLVVMRQGFQVNHAVKKIGLKISKISECPISDVDKINIANSYRDSMDKFFK